MVTEVVRKRMNRVFLVKVNRRGMSKLVGWKGLVALIGRYNAYLLVSVALQKPWVKWSHLSANDVRVTFYVKQQLGD